MKEFELLGSNAPNEDGSDDGWTSLGIFESYKPSGLPGTSTTNEDIEYVEQGESFRVSPVFRCLPILQDKVFGIMEWIAFCTFNGSSIIRMS
ncbi:MAG: DUF5000 domain-containing lipoprotein [Bacteroides thetaiotaomicron]